MRRDAWNARTWILAVVAGWSLLVAVLAMFGLGGRITPLPADPDLVQPLPRLPAAPPERLGPLPQYAMVGERPLFSEDRRPKPFFLSGEEAAAPAFDLVLSSVLITPRLELAIVQPAQGGEGLRVKLGESPAGFPGWRLTELAPRRAVFDGPEGRRELELRVFDGAGGQPPTVITGTGTVPPAAAPMPGARPTGGNSAPVAIPAGPTPVPAPWQYFSWAITGNGKSFHTASAPASHRVAGAVFVIWEIGTSNKNQPKKTSIFQEIPVENSY